MNFEVHSSDHLYYSGEQWSKNTINYNFRNNQFIHFKFVCFA